MAYTSVFILGFQLHNEQGAEQMRFLTTPSLAKTMQDNLAEKLLRKLSESVADILPSLDSQSIQPETKAALTKLLFAIGKFVETSEDQENLEDGLRRLQATGIEES